MCKHGENSEPDKCSQCIEARGELKVQIRRITRDELSGKLFDNGTPVERAFVLPTEGRKAPTPPIRSARV